MNAFIVPAFVAVPLSVLALDLAAYGHHRLAHAIPWLWRVHQIHHSDPDFDLSVGFRFHPIEGLTGLATALITIGVLGAPPFAVALHEIAAAVVNVFQHANARIPAGLDGILRVVVATPDVHRVHHSASASETDTNFGNLVTWWDRLLGTYRAEPAGSQEAMRLGLDEFRAPWHLGVLWMLAHPLLPSGVEQRLFTDRPIV